MSEQSADAPDWRQLFATRDLAEVVQDAPDEDGHEEA